jgi:hypothetical protein
MATLREVIVFIVRHRPGITDRQLTEAIYGSDDRHQQVNAECRTSPEIDRRQSAGNIGNFVGDTKPSTLTLTLVH